MRKASQDGGDNTSITSGIESEIKRPGAGILKSTRNSIKRKVQNFSTESDDTAEPLLHKNKEKAEIEKQSSKFLISKTKTDFVSDKGDDRDKLLADDENTKPSISDVARITRGATLGNSLKDKKVLQPISTSSIHNHMNTNVFNEPEGLSNSITPKAQVLVELDVSKPVGPRYSPSPLIFTTAKIHTDGKMHHMEPVQMTPVPILSTLEGGVVKTETKLKENDETNNEKATNNDIQEITKNGVAKLIKEREVITSSAPLAQETKLINRSENVNVTVSQNVTAVSSNEKARCASSSNSSNTNVKDVTILQKLDSDTSYITTANKLLIDETLSSKQLNKSPENKNVLGTKLTDSTKNQDLTNASKYIPTSSRVIVSPPSSKPFNNICSSKEIDVDVSPSSTISHKGNRNNIAKIDTIKTLAREKSLNENDGLQNEIPAKDPMIPISDTFQSKAISSVKTPFSKPPGAAQSTSPVMTSLPKVLNINNAINKHINSTSTVTNTTSSTSADSTANKTKAIVDCIKISTISKSSDLISTNQVQLHENDLQSVSIIQTTGTMKNTDGSASKSTPNNTATVVSSITKAKNTASSTKSTDASTARMIKASSLAKQPAPSTVRTVFSANPATNQIVKSSTVHTPSVKSNPRSTLNEVDKSKPTLKSNTGSTSDRTGGGAPKHSTKPTISSTLTKAQKNATDDESRISECIKDSKGSKVDK